MGLLMRSPPVDLSSESIYYLRSRRSQAAVGNARSTSLVVLVKSASRVPRPEARCPAGALFTGVRGIEILGSTRLQAPHSGRILAPRGGAVWGFWCQSALCSSHSWLEFVASGCDLIPADFRRISTPDVRGIGYGHNPPIRL